MKNEKIPIIFFGSGPVAADSLNEIRNAFDIELVITKQRPAYHKEPAPVELLSSNNGLEIAFANTREGVDKVLSETKFKSKIGLIIDFGVIVSEFAINKFNRGIINSHFSLLPKWRGADPITFALLSGDKETGVSLMKIVPKLDEGPLIAQEKLSSDITAMNSIELTRRLIDLSSTMIKRHLPEYVEGLVDSRPQSTGVSISYSHKITKADGIIDWGKTAKQIEREIRAYAGWPKSRTTLGAIDCILTQAKIADQSGLPGKYKLLDNRLLIFAGDKSLDVIRIQPAGKREMSADEFIRGYKARLTG